MKALPPHIGRPLYSRRRFGYGDDIAALARLRRAVLEDRRITTKRYVTISNAIRRITLSLAPFKVRSRSR
jgi:hypothetical protein